MTCSVEGLEGPLVRAFSSFNTSQNTFPRWRDPLFRDSCIAEPEGTPEQRVPRSGPRGPEEQLALSRTRARARFGPRELQALSSRGLDGPLDGGETLQPTAQGACTRFAARGQPLPVDGSPSPKQRGRPLPRFTRRSSTQGGALESLFTQATHQSGGALESLFPQA